MKKIYLSLFTCLGFLALQAQQDTLLYRNLAERFARFYAADAPDSLYGLFAPNMRKAVPAERWHPMFAQLKQQLGRIGPFSYEKHVNGHASYTSAVEKAPALLNLFIDSTGKIVGLFARAKPAATPTNFVFSSPRHGPLYGTLTRPADTTRKVPVVLWIAGSGPTDRNGNGPVGLSTNSYQQLADSLKNRGIAMLRYDKRFIGESLPKENLRESKRIQEVVLEDFIEDAAGLVRQLKADHRFSTVVVAGHSEGALIGMIAARQAGADGYVSIAGAGRPIDQVLARQLEAGYPAALAAAARPLLDSLRKGLPVKAVPAELSALFNPAVQPFLISWMQYNPQAEMQKLTLPVLLVQGTTDLQVHDSEAQLLKKARPAARLVVLAGMNHVLKAAPVDRPQNLATYTQPGLPLHPGLVPALAGFIHSIQ